MASKLEFRKAEEAVREAGWEQKWLKMHDVMCEWDRQLIVWVGKHAILNNAGEAENDMNADMRVIKDVDL